MNSFMKWVLALGLAALAVLPSAAVADVTDGSFALVDRPSGFGALPFDGANSSSTSDRSISANGCYVVFQSNNDNLLSGDDDAFPNIYRQDRCTPGHPVVLVSAAGDGTPANGNSFVPSISASGRYVAFFTSAPNLDPAVGDNGAAVVVKDMSTGAVEVANRADGASGAVAPATFDAVISGDGRHVAFVVGGPFDAANVDGVANDRDAYVRFLDTGRTYMASLTSSNAHAGGVSFTGAELSYDGGSVAFVSANRLVGADTDQNQDAYLVRGYTGASPSVQLASYDVGNLAGSDSAEFIALSTSGKYIAWANDRVWWTICDPSCGPDAQADGSSGGFTEFTSLSFANGPNGTTAPTHLFWSNARSLNGADTNNEQDVYSRDITAGGTAITLLTTGGYARGARGGTATDDGSSLVVFNSASPELEGTDGSHSQTFVRTGGQTTNISQPEGQARRAEVDSGLKRAIHAVSADGRFVAFTSFAPSLGVPLVNGGRKQQAYVRDVVAGTTTPVSFTPDGSPANDRVDRPSIDAAGARVVFMSRASNLSPDVTSNQRQHVYLHDLRTGATTLLDRNPSGAPLEEGANSPEISADGTKVVFFSTTKELTPVTGSNSHVYELDLTTGQFTLVDATPAGTPGNGDAILSDIGGDRVAFISNATNLGGNTTGPPDRDAYVKDLRTGVVFWASIPEDGSSGKSNAFEISLSGNGSRLAFTNSKAGFGYSGDDLVHVFVRDLDPAKTTLVSGGTGNGGTGGQVRSSLSPDGTHVAFQEFLPTTGLTRAYVRDLSASGPLEVAPNARLGATEPSLNANGKCVVFESRSPDIVTPSFGPDYSHVYLRAMGANCPVTGLQVQPPPRDLIPVISKLRVTNKRFAIAKQRTAAVTRNRKKLKRGTAFKFRLSEVARTTITIARKAPGRRNGKRCVKPRPGLKKRCTRYLSAMKLTRSKTKLGANTVAFTGRVGKKKLTPGAYRATLVATDPTGNRSKPARVTFTVVRG
jgi:hypothetical protein